MTADTFTSANRFITQGTGNNASTWGQVLNTVIQLIEDSGGGVVQVDVTFGDVTLTTVNGATDQARQKTIQVIGSPGSKHNVIIPNQKKYYLIDNQTSAATSIIVKNVSGTGVTLAPAAKAIVYCDKSSTRAIYNSNGIVALVPVSGGGTGASTAATARTNLGLGNLAVVSVSAVANQLIGTDNSGNVINVSVRNPVRVSAGVAQIDTATSASAGVIRIATSAEALAGTSRVTAISPAGVKLISPFSAKYTSGQTSIGAVGTTTTFAHGLGVAPFFYSVTLHCVTAEGGYSIGDEVLVSPHGGGNAADGVGAYADATNIHVITGASEVIIYNKTTGAIFLITLANWKFIVKAAV